LALSKSGYRVEGRTFLSACLQAPQYEIKAATSEQPNNTKPFCARRAGFHIIPAAKKEYHLMVILRKKHMRFFLRRHYPHQVKGRRTYLPLSLLEQAPLWQKV